MSEVTLLEIARRLGVSKTAVSLALRGKPGLSATTNARILRLAHELGYAPNPVSAELMALVRAKRHKTGAQTIAFINTFMDPTLLRRIPGFAAFVTGAEKRAPQFGYAVEVFEARAKGMSGERLAGILQARGIRGILVGPRWAMEPELQFPWERFAVVLVGEAESGPHLHRVCNHHVHGCATALSRLAAKGYRRVGVILDRAQEEKYRYDYILGVEQFRRTDGHGVKVEILLYDKRDDAVLEKWIRSNGFDALVSLSDEIVPMWERMRTDGGRDLGYANLSTTPGGRWSGINQHTEEIGAASVDMLRGLLLDGERGTAQRPRILLIEGDWIEGETTPGPAAASQARRR